MSERIGKLVTYHGEFERCHDSIYKIVSDFGSWVDLELHEERKEYAYKIIYSVPLNEIKYVKKEIKLENN